MSRLQSVSLCSGFGGLDLAVEEVFNAETVAHCEWEAAPSKVLAARWPGVPNLHDVKTADWSTVRAEILTAGYPCQPFSHAGQRKGTDDERHLWPHVAEAIRRVRPRLVVLENVAGHRSLGFGDVLGELAADGYDAQWTSLRAADIGAPHGRERLFIVAADTRSGSLARPGAAGDGLRLTPERRNGSTCRHGAARGHGLYHPLVGWCDGPIADAHRTRREGVRPVAAPTELADALGIAAPAAHPNRNALRQQPVTKPGSGGAAVAGLAVQWGQYEPAIRRWEQRLGRLAPAPTETGAKGGQRLSPRFVEWMMGLPAGWVTDVPGISRNDQLKMLGNGVVPQQAAEALRRLLPGLEERAA